MSLEQPPELRMDKSAAIARTVLAEGEIRTPDPWPIEPRDTTEPEGSSQEEQRRQQLQHDVHNPTVEPFKEKQEESEFAQDQEYEGERGTASKGASELLSLFKEWQNRDWFNGKSGSVFERIAEAEVFDRRFLATLSGARSEAELNLYAEAHSGLEGELQALREAAEVLSESEVQESFDLPESRVVAAEYENLIEGGLVDLSDDGSWLYKQAKKVQDEVSGYDWDMFTTAGAEAWVEHQKSYSPQMLLHQDITRTAAIKYAKDKTMPLLDIKRRSLLIDRFVNTAERKRREVAAQFQDSSQKQAKIVGNKQAQVAAKISEVIKENPELLWT